jgi:GT2 family glycosyltransferase
MPKLDFLVIGGQEAGTATLRRLLRDHPQLAVASGGQAPFVGDPGAYDHGLDWHTPTVVANADQAALRGAVTPQYMTGVAGLDGHGVPVEEVAERIAQAVPDVKLIALLRDPVQRAIAHYRAAVLAGAEQRSLARALRQQLTVGALHAARLSPSEINGYVTCGEYGRLIAAYHARFPATQLMVAMTDELESDPGGLLARLLSFLDVDSSWRPQQLEQPHRVAGDAVRLGEADLDALVQRLAARLPDELHGVVELEAQEWNAIETQPGDTIPEPLRTALRRHYAADGVKLEQLCGVRVPWAAAPPPPPRAPAVARPEVSIVVLAHDTPAEVEALLESAVTNTHESYELLLVDNGSSPPGREAHARLAETYGARLIELEENLTFAVANNIGIASAGGAEIALLNSDVVLTSGWLHNMRKALRSAPDVAAVGPRSNFAPGQQGGVWLDDSSPAGVQEFGTGFNHADPARWFEIEWLAGFAILARRAALEAVGGFDESLGWFTGEEVALAQALRDAGWRMLCAGDTFVYHAGHHTFFATGTNRSATRFGRPSTSPVPPDADVTRRFVVDDQDLVFEVRDGMAYHLETWHAALLTGARARLLERAAPGELEHLALGPPVSLCRARGTSEVHVLQGDRRRRVLGNQDRIRRLPVLSMIEPTALEKLAEGPPVRVEDALPTVPEIRKWLPSNPAEISSDNLAAVGRVASEIETALDLGLGYALIRLELDEVLVLNHGMWPAGTIDRARAGVRAGPWAAVAALRHAILTADAVGVTEDRGTPAGAALLEELLFHYDLYPRLRCAATVSSDLRGGGSTPSPSPLQRLLKGRRVALVCPSAVAGRAGADHEAYRRSEGFDVRCEVGLDDMDELESAFAALATDRGAYDIVLTVGGVPTKALCSRLARELDVVALDMGWVTLDDIVHPLLDGGHNPLVTLRRDVESYLLKTRAPTSTPVPAPHALDGRLVRVPGETSVYYIERGTARELLHPGLQRLFDAEPVEIAPTAFLAIPRGTPLCAVHEPLSGPYVLIDGRKLKLELELPVVAIEDLALKAIPDGGGGA